MNTDAFSSRVLVLGCGNTYAGDDGVGPRVAGLLAEDPDLPAGVAVQDAGTRIQELLLDMAVADSRPGRIVIVDATQAPGRAPGECWVVDLADGPARAATDLHAFPALTELGMLRRALGVDVRVVAVQAERIPAAPAEGLSPAVAQALPAVVDLVLSLCR